MPSLFSTKHAFYFRMTSFCHDAFSRFVYIVSKGNKSRPWILPEDLAPLIQDVVGKQLINAINAINIKRIVNIL